MSDQLDAMDYELLDERDPRGEASTNEQGDAINKSAKKAYVHPRFGGLTSKHESYGSGFEEEVSSRFCALSTKFLEPSFNSLQFHSSCL